MKKLAIVAAIAAVMTGPVHAERSPEEGHQLALAAVAQLRKLQPYALEGNGLAGAGPTVYYRQFENPLQASIEKWPTAIQPEARSWGDYMYCQNALMGLLQIGMAQNNGTFAVSGKRAVADYQRLKGKCEAASALTPSELE